MELVMNDFLHAFKVMYFLALFYVLYLILYMSRIGFHIVIIIILKVLLFFNLNLHISFIGLR